MSPNKKKKKRFIQRDEERSLGITSNGRILENSREKDGWGKEKKPD